jgi:murein DD-endopeptidase MepM/ murein hydrolase activator NlpD
VQKKTDILTQNNTMGGRKLKLRWLLAAASLPLLGIAAAFGIAPQTLPLNVPAVEITEDVALPPISAAESSSISTQDSPLLQFDQVRRDDTLSTLLERMNIRNPEAISFLRTARDAQALATQLRPGRTLLTKTTESGELLELQFQLDINHALIVKKTANGYVAEEMPLTLENRVIVKSAEIRSSLFAATDEAGIPDQIAIKVANIFSSDIDFNTDLRRGDRFTVIYEASYSNGELIKTGRVLSTEFTNNGKMHDAVLYKVAEGKESYYTPEGKSLQKAFLRSPLEFSRISSGFSLARFHPVLNKWRAHEGVDYAAPIGTRVRAVSDATVTFVGTQNGYGNVIMLQHTNGISTVYGHLSRFAVGLHRGQKVSQGDDIGYVGMTGLATGPHLHYEFRINGEHHDPLTVALPTAIPLPAEQLAAFSSYSKPLLEQLALLRGSNLASLE